MGFNNGTYTRNENFSADASAGIKILAASQDREWDDLASALTNVVWTRDGNTVPIVDIPMGGKKFINVAAATSVADYMRVKEFIENIPLFMQDTATSADRISVSSQYFTSVSANQAPGDGTRITIRVLSDKSSAVLYLDGHSANVEHCDGNRLGPALVSGGIYEFIYSSVDVAWKVHQTDKIRTSSEVATAGTPANLQYPVGHPSRYHNADIRDDRVPGFWDYGHAGTRVDSRTFTISGDVTALYPFGSRLRLIDDVGGRTYWRVQNVSYSAPDTTIIAQSDSGNVPNTIVSIAISLLCQQGPPTFLWDTTGDGAWFWNNADTSSDVGRIAIAVGETAGSSAHGAENALAIVATHPNRSSPYLVDGGVAGAGIYYHTGTDVDLFFGVSDSVRMHLQAATEPTIFRGAEEALRLCSPRDDDSGGVWLSFHENDETTRKGYVGFANGGSNDRFEIANEESGADLRIQSQRNLWLAPAAGSGIYLDSGATIALFSGTGSPENVVTANVGSLYLRTDGGATTTLYVKTSGTGNTGWTAK